MLATKLRGQITRDRKLVVEIPQTVATGAVEVILLHLPDKPAKSHKRRRSVHPAFGIWANRADLADPISFVGELRRCVETRADGRPTS